MAKIESIAFSFGLLMAGLLVLSAVAPVAGPAPRTEAQSPGGTDVAGLAVARAA